MKADIYMKLYVGDYLKDTQRLTTVQHGAYLLLLLDYWATRTPPPDDDVVLATIAKLDAQQWQGIKLSLRGFFDVRGGFWHHKRVERELAEAQRQSERRSVGGKMTANRRKQAEQVAKLQAGLPLDGQLSTIQSESESESYNTSIEHRTEPARFEKPTIIDVKLRCRVIDLPEAEGEKFFAYYESNGWRVGRNPMKSWHAALTNWKHKYTENANRSTGNRPSVDRSRGTTNEGRASDYSGIG